MLTACFALALLQTSFPRVPVDNEWFRVVNASNVPGQKSRLHKHDVNRVMIHLDAGVMRLAFQDGQVDDVRFRPGDVRWDPAGGLHTSENIGGASYRAGRFPRGAAPRGRRGRLLRPARQAL
jgi:hypothetical protein